MKGMCRLGVAALLVVAAASAGAHELTVSPSTTAVLPEDELGRSRVAITFDIGGMIVGEGRRIDDAWLEWRLTGAPEEGRLEFEAWTITGSWSEEGDVAVAEEPVAFWEIEPLDQARNGGALLRLDLRSLVAEWASGAAENHGVVVTSADLDLSEFEAQLPDSRLVIRYGFVEP
jgi:hypothetical protein